jgi:hypothetical protein
VVQSESSSCREAVRSTWPKCNPLNESSEPPEDARFVGNASDIIGESYDKICGCVVPTTRSTVTTKAFWSTGSVLQISDESEIHDEHRQDSRPLCTSGEASYEPKFSPTRVPAKLVMGRL